MTLPALAVAREKGIVFASTAFIPHAVSPQTAAIRAIAETTARIEAGILPPALPR